MQWNGTKELLAVVAHALANYFGDARWHVPSSHRRSSIVLPSEHITCQVSHLCNSCFRQVAAIVNACIVVDACRRSTHRPFTLFLPEDYDDTRHCWVFSTVSWGGTRYEFPVPCHRLNPNNLTASTSIANPLCRWIHTFSLLHTNQRR